MKAIKYKDYGDSNVIEYVEVPQPVIRNENEVLLQVKAAGVNPIDVKIRKGLMKAARPVKMPFIPGGEASGIVVAVGGNVTRFKVGDEIIALTRNHAYAQYAIANEDYVSLKPQNLSFEEAAAITVNLGTTEAVLFQNGKLEKGQTVLIQGGGGAVGGTLVQVAKSAGAYVIATASGVGVSLAKELGANEVIDYKLQDVSTVVKNVDLVADTAGGESQAKLFEVLKPGGTLLSIVVPPSQELAKQYNVKAGFVASDSSSKNLERGIGLINSGEFKTIVAKTFKLEDAATAQDSLSAGSVNGKIVLIIE